MRILPTEKEDLVCYFPGRDQAGLPHGLDEVSPLGVTQVIQGTSLEHGSVNGSWSYAEDIHTCRKGSSMATLSCAGLRTCCFSDLDNIPDDGKLIFCRTSSRSSSMQKKALRAKLGG